MSVRDLHGYKINEMLSHADIKSSQSLYLQLILSNWACIFEDRSFSMDRLHHDWVAHTALIWDWLTWIMQSFLLNIMLSLMFIDRHKSILRRELFMATSYDILMLDGFRHGILMDSVWTSSLTEGVIAGWHAFSFVIFGRWAIILCFELPFLGSCCERLFVHGQLLYCIVKMHNLQSHASLLNLWRILSKECLSRCTQLRETIVNQFLFPISIVHPGRVIFI